MLVNCCCLLLLLFFRGVTFTDGLKCFVKRNFLIFFLLPFLNIKFFFSCYTEFNNLYHPEFLQDIFIKYEYHYLNATKVGTFTVHNSLGCPLKCLGNPFCLSVNLAASKGADGKFWCELLSSEKYSNPKMYEGNKSSHHLTIMVRLNYFLFSMSQNIHLGYR